MACSFCSNGPFDVLTWRSNSSEVRLDNGVRVRFLTSNGVNTGVRVIKGIFTKDFQALGGTPYFEVWGTPFIYLAILIVGRPDSGGGTLRSVFLIDTETSSLTKRDVVSVFLPSSKAIPFIEACANDGSVVFTGSPGFGQNERVDLGIYTSNGKTRIAGVSSNTFAGFVHAKTFPDSFKVIGGTSSVILSGDRSLGVSNLSPSQINFGTVTVGATDTERVTIENTGANCLKIHSIVNTPHFTVLPVISNRVLQPGESINVDVTFRPTAVTSYEETLEIRGPLSNDLVEGENRLRCMGSGEALLVELEGQPNFGKVPVLTSRTNTFQIRNNSDLPISYNVSGSGEGSPFRWSDLSGDLQPGQATAFFRIPFVAPPIVSTEIPPPFEKSYREQFRYVFSTPSGGANMQIYQLRAIACRPQPRIEIDFQILLLGIDFGILRAGEKRLRSLTVANPANSTLHYSARIVSNGHSNAIFRLQLTDDINEQGQTTLNNLSAQPISPCGSGETGSGDSIFYISVFGIIGGIAQANLEIFDHNVTDGSALDIYQITLIADIRDVIKSVVS
jgi:hypothetical protein